MRHLDDDWRLLGLLMHECLRLEQVVVVETVAMTLEQLTISREDEHLLSWTILLRLPEGLELVFARIIVFASIGLLLFVLLKLHIGKRLRQVKVYFVYVLDRVGILDVNIL